MRTGCTSGSTHSVFIVSHGTSRGFTEQGRCCWFTVLQFWAVRFCRLSSIGIMITGRLVHRAEFAVLFSPQFFFCLGVRSPCSRFQSACLLIYMPCFSLSPHLWL